MKPSKLILPVIIISQFCCTTLWFAGNGVINDLIINFNLKVSDVGHLTSSIQFGFIIGTLTFAMLTIADRFSPSKVYLVSALLGALFNIGIIWDGNSFISLLALRFFTGFFLAGIYPVGMKIATDYYQKGLGKSLGFLVGALVLGTAFPHLLKDISGLYSWESVIMTISSLAVFGGVLMVMSVPDGPYRTPSQKTNLFACLKVFKNKEFRAAAFGYFGHMWELYTFWTFVPLMLKKYSLEQSGVIMNIPIISFLIIGIGGLSCVLSGYLAQKFGAKRTAYIALMLSCMCCLISPLIFNSAFESLFIGFLVFWGMVVIADSPLLSTLVAQNTSPEIKGTALTIVNCLGFIITIVSIQFITKITAFTNSNYVYTLLAIGPLLGLVALRQNNKETLLNKLPS